MIDIRFNTNFPIGKSKFEWRVIKDGVEHLVNYVHINCKSHSTSRFIEGEGEKYHITANTDLISIVNEISDDNSEYLIAYIG
jgi:hypothetical protein